ncbi:hypothetical protein J1605_004287 [Eschrichtius robustus]|uniref:Uncharacterized protein n=1 Tax=Eschrichtius robustus TaxID=9764 RepID=A0AB34HK32_ESCRO|nr:hypothetical protein J1605_004287 [Eschrichtius robustus]
MALAPCRRAFHRTTSGTGVQSLCRHLRTTAPTLMAGTGLSSTPVCGAPTVRPYIPPTFHRAVDPPTLPSVYRSAGPLEDLGPRPFLEHRTRPAPAPASQPASQRLAHPSETSRLATVPEAQPGLEAWSPAHARLEDRLQLHRPEGRQEGRAATVRGGLPELVVWTPLLRSQPNRSSLPQRGSFFPCWIPTAIKETQAEILTAHARVEGLAHQSTSPPGAHEAGSLKVTHSPDIWAYVAFSAAAAAGPGGEAQIDTAGTSVDPDLVRGLSRNVSEAPSPCRFRSPAPLTHLFHTHTPPPRRRPPPPKPPPSLKYLG